MKRESILALVCLTLLIVPSGQSQDSSLVDDLELNRVNLLELIGDAIKGGGFQEDVRVGLLELIGCWIDDVPTVADCGDIQKDENSDEKQALNNLINEYPETEYEFVDENQDRNDDGDPDLSVAFDGLPDSVKSRDTPKFTVSADDSRGRDAPDSIGYGDLSLEYRPEYIDSFSQVREQTCEDSDPYKCSFTINNGFKFPFNSPGTTTLRAKAVAGDGADVETTQEVDVGVGQPPNPVDLEFSGIDGDYGGDWEPALDEDWDEPDYQRGSTEKLAFVKDEFDNVLIDTGNSYLYGGAFLQKKYFGDEDGLLKLEYRLRVEESGIEKANEFGIVTDSDLNSTVDLNSMSDVDLSNSIDQTGKRYSLTLDLSRISGDDININVGVFPAPGFVQSDGGGEFGNGLRLIMEDISVVGGRDVEFQRTRPDNLDLVRGEESTIRYKVTDSLDQFDLAKMNVSYELNPQENSGKTEISDKRCSAKSSGYCRLQFDFTPQKLGEYNFTVGLETKTGKYFSKEYNYVSRPTSEPNDISTDSGLGDNGLFFKWIDGYESPDLYGKKVNAYKCVDGSFAEEPEPENRCRANEKCFVPGPEGGSDFSGYYNITLNTEDQEKVIDHLTVSLDAQKTSCP